jgi:hypothetical protein
MAVLKMRVALKMRAALKTIYIHWYTSSSLFACACLLINPGKSHTALTGEKKETMGCD